MSNFGIEKGGRQFRPATLGMERRGDRLFHNDSDRGEAELGVSGQVEHTNGDGSTQDLARQIAQVYRRVAAPLAGQSLTPPQRRSIRDQIIAATVGQGDSHTQEAIRLIANLMAGLPVDDKTILLGLSLDPEKLANGSDLSKALSPCEKVPGATCPYCGKITTIELTRAEGLPPIKCPLCRKGYDQDSSCSERVEKSEGKYSDLRQAMQETHEWTMVLIAQINELVAKRSGAAPTTTMRFRANAPDKIRDETTTVIVGLC